MKSRLGSGKTCNRKSGKAHARHKPSEKLTRREWLVRVGEGATLLGLGGAGWEPEESRGMTVEHAKSDSDALPAGLYQPSLDCLTRALESDARYPSVPAGTETDYVQPRRAPYEPRFFTESEFKTVPRLVRLMLGEPVRNSVRGSARLETYGETCEQIAEWIDLTVAGSAAVRDAARKLSPQHRNLAVEYYGAEAVRRLETDDPQKTWRAGLDWLAVESRRRCGRPLSGLGRGKLRQLLELVGDDRPDHPARNAGTELFKLLKAEIIRGYYTSARGLHDLGYKGNAFYAVSPGCPKHTIGNGRSSGV
jgi:hypothetical protein